MKIAFISAMESHPWGGSEELWSGAAFHLLEQGHQVSVCVKGWQERQTRAVRLEEAGALIYERREQPGLGVWESRWQRLARRIRPPAPRPDPFSDWLGGFAPDLVCVSNGNYKDGLHYMERVREMGFPYVPLCQANAEFLWPDDGEAGRLMDIYRDALAVHGVSRTNLDLIENQLAIPLPHARVVFNPCQVKREVIPGWPPEADGYRLACVGRLEPDAKGQDLMFQVLARPAWRNRKLTVALYGSGSAENGLRRLAAMHGVLDRVHFAGQVADVTGIWAANHGLILPSRYEGLPLALVEAMLCARVAIVTDVAGNRELVSHGVNGFMAAAPTVDLLDAAMEESWANRGNWQSMGIRARETALARIPLDPCLEYANLLVSIAGSR